MRKEVFEGVRCTKGKSEECFKGFFEKGGVKELLLL